MASMTLRRGWIAFAFLAILAVTLISCGEPTAPEPGFVQFSVTTAGGDIDDHFDIVSDTIKVSIAGNAIVTHQVPAGHRLFELKDVADNCTVEGGNVASVNVTKDQPAQVRFKVTCDATGISVQAHTTGSYFPAAYQVLFPSRPAVSLIPNGIESVSRLAVGRYQVKLRVGFSNCAVVGDSIASVDVVNRKMTTVLFEVKCVFTSEAGVIAFVDNVTSIVNVINADGSAQVALTRGWNPSWSRDGSKLVYSTTECDYYTYVCHGSLAMVDPSNRQITTLPAALFGLEPAWSPVDDMIAYVNAYTGRVMIFNLASSTAVEFPLPSNVVAYHPTWSPDGTRLLTECFVSGGNGKLCIFNRDGSVFRLIDVSGSGTGDPEWSPDGTQFVVTSFGNPSMIGILNSDGVSLGTLAAGWQAAWSTNGRQIVFATQTGLFVMNADGSGLRRLTTGNHGWPAWRH